MIEYIIHTLLMALALLFIAKLLPAVTIKGYKTGIVVIVLYSIIHFILGGLLTLISFPLMILTFGLFKFVINAFILWITDRIIDSFDIRGFGWTLLTAVLLAAADTAIKSALF